jgi:hypothetical protein
LASYEEHVCGGGDCHCFRLMLVNVKRRHIGFVIFGLCSALSARIAIFEPKPQVPTPAEERWGTANKDEGDPLHLIHAVRYYIYGLGVLGLLMVVEDFVSEKSRKKKRPDTPPRPTHQIVKRLRTLRINIARLTPQPGLNLLKPAVNLAT